MTASNAVTKLHRRNSGWLKPTLIVLCLVLAGFGAITVAEVTGARTHKVEDPVAQRAVSMSADSPTAPQATSYEANDTSGEATSTPRECQPYEGVVSECIFN